jgi:hypothetical protein
MSINKYWSIKISGKTTATPITDDRDNQYDPYNKNRPGGYSPEKGQQLTTFCGEGTTSESAGGSEYRQPPGVEDPNHPEYTALPTGHGPGDVFPSDSDGTKMLPADSPLQKENHDPVDKENPYGTMYINQNPNPYAIFKKRIR